MSEPAPRYQFIELDATADEVAIIQDTDNLDAWLQSTRYVPVEA